MSSTHKPVVRRFAPVLMAMALFAAACGGSDTPTVNAPSTPLPPSGPAPGIPTAMVLATGDGQTAPAGAALPVSLSVSVRDGNGNPVTAVAVRFAIDSGGGSLSAATATTGADGVAGGVIWTLGGIGSNVVTVTVGALPTIRFHAVGSGPTARTVIAAQAVAPGGGTITYEHTGDPLNGLKITVPPQAYASGSTWTIVADSTIAITLPTGFSLAGPPLVIGNGQGYANANMTLTVPLPINDTIATAPFYYDPTTQLFEPIALVGRTTNTATLATHHFSADLLARPAAAGASALHAHLGGGEFGNVVVVWVQIPLKLLVGTYTSNFSPGTDDWEFENWGDFIAPGGDCEGMSITAMYYWYTFRRGPSPNGGLYHRYDKSVANMIDNDQGIRYSGSVQGDYEAMWNLGFSQIAALIKTATALGTHAELLTSSWIPLTIRLTQQPVLITLNADNGAHAVIAYAATVTAGGLTTIRVSDPNQPGRRDVTMNFVNGLFTPTNFADNAGATPHAYTAAYAVGVSGELPIPALAARWYQFAAKQAGTDRYPTGFTLEAQNKASGLWHTVTGHKLVVYDSTIDLRTHCPACVTKVDNSVHVWDKEGRNSLGWVPLTYADPHAESFWLGLQVVNGTKGAGYVGADSLEIVWHKVSIDAPDETPLFTQLTYTALNPPNVPGTHYTFTWDFGDGTATVIKDDDPVAKHTYSVHGHYVVTVTIKVSATTELIAKATLKQNASLDIVFVFTRAEVTSRALPLGGIGPERSDTLAQGMIEDYLEELTVLRPTNSVLYFVVDPAPGNCRMLLLEQFDLNTTPTFDNFIERNLRAMFASNCDLEPDYTTSLAMGPLGSGTMVGFAKDSPNLPEETLLIWHGGSINARMTGRNLTGTITWNVQYSTGMAIYTFTFQAVQVIPQ